MTVFVFAPSTIATVIGRPLYVDCGGLEANVCDETWRSVASDMERLEGVSGPVTGVVIGDAPLDLCPDVSIDRWWLFGILGMTAIRDC